MPSLGDSASLTILGLAYVALWQWLGAEDPRQCWFISKEEQRFLSQHAAKPSRQATAGNGRRDVLGIPNVLLKHPALWAIFGAHMAFNYGAYFITNWSPIYYSEVFGLAPDEAKWYLAAPHVTNLACKALNQIQYRTVRSTVY